MRCEQIGSFFVLPVTEHPVNVINQFIWQKKQIRALENMDLQFKPCDFNSIQKENKSLKPVVKCHYNTRNIIKFSNKNSINHPEGVLPEKTFSCSRKSDKL